MIFSGFTSKSAENYVQHESLPAELICEVICMVSNQLALKSFGFCLFSKFVTFVFYNVCNFYPSFDVNHKIPEGVRFFKDSKGKQDITASATSMDALANALGSTNGMLNTLYAKIPEGVEFKCYATVDASFDDAFGDTSVIDYGVATKFTDSFAAKYCEDGVTGAYFDNSSDSDSWKQTLDTKTEPTVNGVKYTEFCHAYKSGLSHYGCWPSSAVGSGTYDAYGWSEYGCWYKMNRHKAECSILLTKAF